MTHHAFPLSGATMHARASGALWWPEARLLAVSDLHLGRSARGARRGGALLPPYEGPATLDRLAAEIAALAPAIVVSLGDSFDDDDAPDRMDAETLVRLSVLAAGRRWVWIAGNHDPAPLPLPGEQCATLTVTAPDGPVTLRHIAEPAAGGAEISGHWHPKARIAGGPGRACFLLAPPRLILPAFGAYVGGLDIAAPPLRALMPEGLAILTGRRAIPAPLGALRAQSGGARRRR